MIIDLLRHGEADGEACLRGHSDEPLSKKGWLQMSNALKGYDTKKVVCSPLKRCADFSEQWADDKKISLLKSPEFMEINFGAWDGLSIEAIQKNHNDELNAFWNNPVNNTPPNGEHLIDFQTRVVSAWESLVHENKNNDLLLITHGGVIRIIIAHVLSIPLNKLLSLECPLASMSRIRISFDNDEKTYSSLVFHAHKHSDNKI